MKPLLYAFLIIVFIIFMGLYTVDMLGKDAEILHDFILQMENSINKEEWEEVNDINMKFHYQWEKSEKIWPMLIDHLEIDNINIQLSELESYLKNKDKIKALSKLSILKLLVKHIPERESFILQNIL